MIVDKLFIFLVLVHGILCQKGSTSADETPSDDLTITTNDDLSISTDDDTTAKTSYTDVDTKGDIIITSEPEVDTDVINDTVSTVTDNISDTTTINLTTSTELVTFPEEANISACSSSPCKNGGTCQEDTNIQVPYKCDCLDGYTGILCQVMDRCVVDDKGNVCNKGACAYSKDGLVRSCKCFLGKFWDEGEKECKESQPPCLPNPCLNGGTCIKDSKEENFKCVCRPGYEGTTCDIANWCPEGDECENGQCVLDTKAKKKQCECSVGFYWNEEDWECEDVEPPCFPNPCKNNGICEYSLKNTNNFTCTCLQGFVGLKCETQDFCTPSTDGTETCENGICEMNENSKKCCCNAGFYLDETTQTCKEVKQPCLPNPCFNYGVCVPLLQEHFNCTCSEGYVGHQCSEMDFCVLEGGNGFCNEAECRNHPQLKLYDCSCEKGHYFDYTTRKCIIVDFCPLMECGENEVCEKSSCKCIENYERNNSSGNCEPQLCSSNPCPIDDLICTQDIGIPNYQCACEKGYAFNGTHCNGGASCVFPNLNSCQQICQVSEGNVACSCEENSFRLNQDNKTCSPLFSNETCINKTCDMGNCVVVADDSEMCVCPPGYTEISGKCVDLCSAGLLPKGFCPNNQCEATSTGFRCKCDGKYVLSEDGTTCTARKMCEESEIGWSSCSSHNAMCVEDWNTMEGYRCECVNGQVPSQNGDCHDVCSEAENQKTCSNFGAECDSAEGELTCRCPPYFQPFKNGTYCNKPAKLSYLLTLPLNPEAYRMKVAAERRQRRSVETEYSVDYAGIERDVRATIGNFFQRILQTRVLICRESKHFILCKVEIQFSSVSEENLKRLRLPENCLTMKESADKCLLPPSLVLQRDYITEMVTYEKTDPCDADIKENLCGSDTLCTSSSSRSSFNCTCKEGFVARNKRFPIEDTESYVESCRDINECLEENACSQNMNCQNTIGSYTCTCKSRYRMKDRSNPNRGCIEICNPNPCVHGLCSEVGDHDFECRCDAGYSGMLCNLRDENFKRAWTNTVVVGAVLGGALLVTIIISFVYTSRLKKKKYADAPDQMLFATEMTQRRNVDSGTINNAFQREQ